MEGWMECLGVDVNRMRCGMGWSGGGWVGKGDGDVDWGEDVKSGWVRLGLGCDWAIVCGVCYYPKLLQMQQLHPNPRPRLVITNSADNTH